MLDYHSFDFDLAGLAASGKQWDMNVPMALLQDKTVGTIDAVDDACSEAHWSGSIEKNDGGFAMHAALSMDIKRRCDRCLEDFAWQLTTDSKRDFAIGAVRVEENESEERLDELDVLVHPGRMNLVDLLREEVWLAWRPVLVCDEACPGLCPDCGHGRSGKACKCAQQVDDDHPFAALRKLQQKT
ncbi:MAG: DUF177 domain-containing protein [Mariprofundaceae bacterium]|nr:DUF177 domain-containing protein [Mariprofundaceae bacterium]